MVLGLLAIEELISILITTAISITIFVVVKELVDVFEEHDIGMDDVLELPKSRGGINIPGLGSVGEVASLGVALAEAITSSEAGVKESPSSRKRGDKLSKEKANANKEKTKDEVDPRTEHLERKKGERNTADGKPNSSADEFTKDGKLKQRRYYDENGKPQKDIDYTDHGNPKDHEAPHDHYWGENGDGDPIRYN